MEFDLLDVFARHPRQTLSRARLAELAHGRPLEPGDRSIDIRITRLARQDRRGRPRPEDAPDGARRGIRLRPRFPDSAPGNNAFDTLINSGTQPFTSDVRKAGTIAVMGTTDGGRLVAVNTSDAEVGGLDAPEPVFRSDGGVSLALGDFILTAAAGTGQARRRRRPQPAPRPSGASTPPGPPSRHPSTYRAVPGGSRAALGPPLSRRGWGARETTSGLAHRARACGRTAIKSPKPGQPRATPDRTMRARNPFNVVNAQGSFVRDQ